MKVSFVGKVKHKVDAKGRVSLPTNFRMIARDGDPAGAPDSNKCQIVLMHGRKAKCLMGYSIASYADLTKQVEALDPYSPDTEGLKAIAFGNADYFDVDDAGRFGLREMREIAGFGDEVIFFGLGANFEIWEKDAFTAVYGDGSSVPERDPFLNLRPVKASKKKKKKKKSK